ncbi:polysaccharide pyruvyl transferase CsaB [Heliorestis convoluta]|uniref:Polysaccharide pyruvyl transferase CsaB n=1 Tax=Heliorestis convoluta TaxID=356322 RepID=A0A5Q2N0B9_9FIRM|nr:polysaccharide pyruvyl transferase CsaB [Heliorestis convoluta]QGG47183.1 polysaccharide pyruvyl transferase CsaB [Heliorestis convoluta]
MATIVLSGYYGYENAGDEALLRAMIASLRRLRPNIEIIVLSGKPEATVRDHDVQAIYRYNPYAVLKALRQADLVISGGGSLLQDVTGKLTIPYYLLIVALANRMQRKVMFYAQGIGPVQGNFGKSLIRHIANDVDIITLRDIASAERLREMGVNKPMMKVTGDPVFALYPLAIEDLERNKAQESNGISPASPSPSQQQPPTTQKARKEAVFSLRPFQSGGQAEQACLELARHLLEQNWRVTFLPMHAGEDVTMAQEMTRHLDHPNAEAITDDLHFEQALRVIARSQLLIGVRLHSLMFATLLGIPIIGISYDPKVTGFLQETNRPVFGDQETPLTGQA